MGFGKDNGVGEFEKDGRTPKFGKRVGLIETIEDNILMDRHKIDNGDGETLD